MMMQGVPGIVANSGDGAGEPQPTVEVRESGGGGSASGGFGELEDRARIDEIVMSERNSGGGNRWPRQETLALLKIRSDMDVTFRDSGLKGPLWEEVSRKMAELGFHRNPKKCKEKFENVYKYHKRTKEVRSSKPDGKTYRFFDQLKVLENSPPLPPLPLPQRTQVPAAATTAAMPAVSSTTTTTNPSVLPPQVTIPSTMSDALVGSSVPEVNPPNNDPLWPPLQPPSQQPIALPPPPPTVQFQSNVLHNFHPDLFHSGSSSSTSSDSEPERRCKRKRKWNELSERLMREVTQKQEELHNKFMETLERRERERIKREEAWRVQETARLNREHDLLLQERSMAAAKDAAVIAFLQKVAGQQNIQNPIAVSPRLPENLIPKPQPPPPPPTKPPILQPPPASAEPVKVIEPQKTTNGGENLTPASSSRWPKSEVEALIKLRTDLDLKYQDMSPKGPLWEEISSAMRALGYNRNAKRCKEKWENINKYFKKVKESNKKRPEDSRTCPYFHQLDALYRERAKVEASPATMAPIMARPEQQWPAAIGEERHQDLAADVGESLDDEEDEDDDEDGGGFEIVASKASSVSTQVE